ncbi:MAG: isocitrate/isopropylmalate dehydrogenase family protein [Bryobacteraceae bacterium]
MYDIAFIRGDGIGPEITEATQRVLESAGAGIRWHDTPAGEDGRARLGHELPLSSLETIRRLGVVLKAPLIAERCTGGVVVESNGSIRRHPSVNNGLRRELNLFVNVRPVRGWTAVSGAYAETDLVIMREVTEDMYSGIERQVNDGCAEAVKRITRRATERLTHYACDYALRHGRRTVSAIHKANVLHLTDGLFLRTVRETVADYSALNFSETAIDAACYLLVKRPTAFDVMVLPNQYGDIISDLAAGLVGSLGLAPGANIGDDAAMFEAAHGAAPDIAGQGIANPIGLVLSGAMLLDHIGEREAAGRVRTAVDRLLADSRFRTPDLGGTSRTSDFTEALCAEVQTV